MNKNIPIVQPTTATIIQRLESALSPDVIQLMHEAGQIAANQGSSLYVVGGIVRDLLLNWPIDDVDFVVEGDAAQLAQRLQARYGGDIVQHRRFGTARWYAPDIVTKLDHLDFATARTETYAHPAALPDVQPATFQQDIQRRDFSINTLAICLTPPHFGELLDLYQGYPDLLAGEIKVLHEQSFIDDPTRIFRAVRFEQRFDFAITPPTLALIQGALPIVTALTPQRILTELVCIFAEPVPEKTILQLEKLGVLAAIEPNLNVPASFGETCQKLRSELAETPWAKIAPAPVHYLGLLTFFHSLPAVKAIATRLNLPHSMADPLWEIQAIKGLASELTLAQKPSDLYQLLHPFSDDALLICWLAWQDAMLKSRLMTFSRDLRGVMPFIDGHYLIKEFGLKPSPQFKQILTGLQAARLDGELDTLADEHRWVNTYLTQPSSDSPQV